MLGRASFLLNPPAEMHLYCMLVRWVAMLTGNTSSGSVFTAGCKRYGKRECG